MEHSKFDSSARLDECYMEVPLSVITMTEYLINRREGEEERKTLGVLWNNHQISIHYK